MLPARRRSAWKAAMHAWRLAFLSSPPPAAVPILPASLSIRSPPDRCDRETMLRASMQTGCAFVRRKRRQCGGCARKRSPKTTAAIGCEAPFLFLRTPSHGFWPVQGRDLWPEIDFVDSVTLNTVSLKALAAELSLAADQSVPAPGETRTKKARPAPLEVGKGRVDLRFQSLCSSLHGLPLSPTCRCRGRHPSRFCPVHFCRFESGSQISSFRSRSEAAWATPSPCLPP
eukprot:757637-Rhodomonas_salina.1